MAARVSGTPLVDMPHTASELSDVQLTDFSDTMRGWFTQLRQLRPTPSGLTV